MNIEDLFLDESSNPRQITEQALRKLEESIERDPEFMGLRPIVVDSQGTVVAGNQRFKALQRLGYKEIPDSWVMRAESLTDEQLRRFRIVDNSPPGMSGAWDVGKLLNEWDQDTLEAVGLGIEIGGEDLFASKQTGEGEAGSEGEGGDPGSGSSGGGQGQKSKTIVCPNCGGEFDD